MSAWDLNKVFDRYVDALLSLSNDSATRQTWLAQTTALHGLLGQNADLARVLADPRVNSRRKEAVVLDMAQSMKLDTALTRTLAVFLRQGRGGKFAEFLGRLNQRLKKELGVVVAQVTAAAPLTSAQEAALAKSLGEKVELNTRIDPELLGGLVVQIGSWRMDDSVKGKLERLSRRLKTAA